MQKRAIWLFTLFWCSVGFAQKHYRMESLTVADGLSQGFVMSLFEDSRGFIWIGTFNGLNRYDGYQVKRFIPDNTAAGALKCNLIFCISEDADGLLWLGTEKGLVILDPYTEQFIHLTDIDPAFPDDDIVKMDIKAGKIWLSGRKNNKGGSAVANRIYTVTTPPDLVRLIRENKVSARAFTVQSVAMPPDLDEPFIWLQTSSDTQIAAADNRGRFYTIDPATLQIRRVDPRTLDYQRMGNYGLLYNSKEHSGFIFPVLEGAINASTAEPLQEFIQLPGQMPLLFKVGDSVLYQLDTLSVPPKGLAPKAGFRDLKPFFTLDKPISFKNMVDRNGNLWVGTSGFGIRKMSPKKLRYEHYLPTKSFYNFRFLPDGRIWPGREVAQKVLNLHTGEPDLAPWMSSYQRDTRVYNFIIAKSGDWWVLRSTKNQLYMLKKDYRNDRWTAFPIQLHFSDYSAMQLLEDHSGNIWASGTKGQILRFRPSDNRVDTWQFDQYFPEQVRESLKSSCLVVDNSGILWLGCNYGLVRIDHPEANPVFTAWHNHTGQGVLFKIDGILSIYPDPNNRQFIWIGLYGGGLHCFDSQSGRSEMFSEKDGLADNVVYGILPDTFGYLWLSTNRGLSRFNPKNRTFYNFTQEDAALNTEFNTDAFCQMPSGDLAFGSVNGLFVVHPLAESRRAQPNIVAMTDWKINGAVLEPAAKGLYMTMNAQNEISLRVPFDKNSISFEFAALQTDDPSAAQYRYRMRGLEEHWIQAGLEHTANFMLIPPGQYTLELQSINANSNWEDAPTTRVYVTVLPPWYRSWLAYLLYASFAGLMLYTYVRYERRNFQLKHAESLSRKEMERLKSLDDFKNRFFGSISHEFKTPLTIILGQARRLLAGQNQQNIDENAEAILQQGQSMLEMVEQILDITRLGDENFRLNWRNGNFSEYVHYLVESLRPLAEFKNIQLDFQSDLPDLTMDFDPLRLKYVINNLLNNAVRHTPSGEFIGVSILAGAQHQVIVEVLDTGEGITAQDLPNIFNRYYQGASSSPQQQHFGIGLTFVKDLVQLFGGSIQVSSQLGNGSLFTITLPITQQAQPLLDAAVQHLAYSNYTVQTSGDASKESLPLLLIVEDNPFIAKFTAAFLSTHFAVDFAPDGLSGYEKALEIIPDLILTDVMMPGIDGYELTHRLKGHELTSHIPIVILSARSELSDRLTGQQYGANAYISKPFDEQELILTLKNLHQLQYRWRARYAGLTAQTGKIDDVLAENLPETKETVLQTDAFMLKMYAIFEKKYADEEYDLPQLCRDIEMSKSQLQRKIVALSDQSAMQLLRRFRLQKAYDILLENPDSNVKEVCFQVGFKDPSHFSRLFSKTFQVAPSDVKKLFP